MVKKIQYFLVLTAVFALAASFTFQKIWKDKNGGIRVVVIDAGHGGKDPGCNGLKHKEKDISLSVALRLGKLIQEHMKDVKVIYTRTTDVFVDLEERAQIANKAKADLFISIHCNAAGKPVYIKDPKTGKKRVKTYKNKKGKIVVVEKPNPVPFGTETYVMGLKNEEGKMKVATRENSAMLLEDNYETKYGGFDPESEESYIIMSNYTSAYVLQSANLAMKLQEEYARKAGRYDKGVHRQSIWVLWRTSMPSILTEIGYLTNPLEEEFLGSEKGQDYLAKCIFRGLRKYKDEVEGNKKTYNDEFDNLEPLENENIKAGHLPGQKVEEEEEEEAVAMKEKPGKSAGMGEKEPKEDAKKEPEKSDAAQKDVAIKEAPLKTDHPGEQKKDEEKPLLGQTKSDSGTSKENEVEKNLSAQKIAENYKKKDSGSNPNPVKEKAELPGSTFHAANDKIVFKVQFASAESELNLKEDRFRDVVDASFYRLNKTYKYTSGNYSSIKEAVAHQAQLREKGFKDCFVVALKNGERIDLNEARKMTGQ